MMSAYLRRQMDGHGLSYLSFCKRVLGTLFGELPDMKLELGDDPDARMGAWNGFRSPQIVRRE